MDESKIKEKIRIAEQSVAEIQNSDLKLKAFELVLTNLLQEDTIGKTVTSKQTKIKSIPTVRRSSSVGLKKETKKTQLKFSEVQLTELKNFYDSLKPSGRESNIFILSIFLKEKIGQEEFHEGDIEYCYQQLINLRTINKPPAMNLENIKQTLSWLAAPSRKKQWLDIDANGIFKISAAGTLHFRDLEPRTQNETHKNTTE